MGRKKRKSKQPKRRNEEKEREKIIIKRIKPLEYKSMSRMYFPEEIVLDILLRLPVKSLLRFRAVCKSWHSLISDPSFVQMHLHRTNRGNNNVNLWRLSYVVTKSYSSPTCLYSRGVEPSDKNELERVFEEDNVWTADILASCNGLVLIAFDDFELFWLWNPSTGEYVKFWSGRHRDFTDRRTIWGLGYDSSIDEYKVVSVICFLSPPGSPRYYDTCVRTFNFKTNSWAEIKKDNFPYRISYSGKRGTVVNGAPHWVVTRNNADFSYFPKIRVIIYFDVKEEKFREVPSPIWIDESLKFHLGVLNGCLCMSHNQGSSFEVWTMKEYGVQESWTKLFVIPHSFQYLKPLCFAKDGVLMVVNREEFIVYNLKENTYTTILSVVNRSCRWLGVVTYVESLVSPSVKHGIKSRTKCSRREIREWTSDQGDEDFLEDDRLNATAKWSHRNKLKIKSIARKRKLQEDQLRQKKGKEDQNRKIKRGEISKSQGKKRSENTNSLLMEEAIKTWDFDCELGIKNTCPENDIIEKFVEMEIRDHTNFQK